MDTRHVCAEASDTTNDCTLPLDAFVTLMRKIPFVDVVGIGETTIDFEQPLECRTGRNNLRSISLRFALSFSVQEIFHQ